MTAQQKNLFATWCYNHDITYFVDVQGRHCICDVDWIARFDTEQEMLEYVDEHYTTK